MLEGKFEKLEVPRDVKLTPLKNKMSKNKTKTLKMELKELENKKNDEKNERWMKGQWKIIFHEMILGLITLKHSLGLFILFFGIPNPGLHYVPEKSILLNVDIWTEEFLPWEIFL